MGIIWINGQEQGKHWGAKNYMNKDRGEVMIVVSPLVTEKADLAGKKDSGSA